MNMPVFKEYSGRYVSTISVIQNSSANMSPFATSRKKITLGIRLVSERRA